MKKTRRILQEIRRRWQYAKLEADRLHPEPVEWSWIVYGLGLAFCIIIVIYVGVMMAIQALS